MEPDTRDEHERPTVPNPRLAFDDFDGEAERFFLTGEGAFDGTATLDAPTEEEEVGAWWAEQRRRTLSRLVATLLALCVFLLAAGVAPR